MTKVTIDRQDVTALAERIGAAMRATLHGKLLPAVEHVHEESEIDSQTVAYLLEQGIDISSHAHSPAGSWSEPIDHFIDAHAANFVRIAMSPPSEDSGLAFTADGATAAAKQIRAVARGTMDPQKLNATAIRALAAEGIMRGDLTRLAPSIRDLPRRRRKWLADRIKLAICHLDPMKIEIDDGRPPNVHAHLLIRFLARFFEKATGERAHRDQTDFFNLLNAVRGLTPQANWQGLRWTVGVETRAMRDDKAGSV